MQPGVYAGLSNDDYHGGPGISKSGLDLIRRSPAHFKAARDAANDNQPKEPTPAQMIGTAFHAMVLEPALFTATYCLGLRREDVPDAIDDRDVLVAAVQELNASRLPKLATTGAKAEQVARIIDAEADLPSDLRTPLAELDAMKGTDLKARIERLNETRTGLLPISGSRHELAQLLRDNGQDVTLWSDVQAKWLAANSHRIVLTQEQWDQLMGMRASVMAHTAARRLLAELPGKAELSVYWIDKRTGELCRCRPDRWLQDLGVIVDVKTTEDASPEGFRKSIDNWRYQVQHPMYLDGCTQAIQQAELDIPMPREFVFLAVEKKPPYAVGVYRLGETSADAGRAEMVQDLDVFATCKAGDHWPAYGDQIMSIELPEYKLRKLAYEGAS